MYGKWRNPHHRSKYPLMVKNYFKIALRNILRNKTYSLLNILGLSIGLCACIVIYTIVDDEFSFDGFHPGANRIYRVMGDVTQPTGDKLHFVKLPSKVAEYGRKELSGIDAIAGIIPYRAQVTIPGEPGKAKKNFDSRSQEDNFGAVCFTGADYFRIFPYQWLAGDPASALDAPNKVVLTENKAVQYFGKLPPGQFVGRQIIYDDSLIATVSGVIKQWSENTDLAFSDLISFSSIRNSFLKTRIELDSWSEPLMNTWTFVKLTGSAKPANVTGQMASLVGHHGDPQTRLSLWLQPLAAIHFDADVIEYGIRTADKPTLYSLITIVAFILLLAIVNFVNLSTAQVGRRAKEVGIRKVLGSNRRQLVVQFLTETLILTSVAVLLGLLFVKPVFSFFRSFIPAGIHFRLFDWPIVLFLLAITGCTTILAGFYPAQVLSSSSAFANLQNNPTQRIGRTWLLRKVLVVFQFAVSLVFIIGCLVIERQLQYTREKDLGFKSDAILLVNTPPGENISKASVVANKVQKLSGIKDVALEWVPPMTNKGRGRNIKLNPTDVRSIGVVQIAGNEHLIPLYGIRLLAGRNLQHSDSLNEFVINEKLSKIMGCKTPEAAVGRTLYWDDKPYPVVGVVSDFHSRSFHEQIEPACIVNRPDRDGTLAIKIDSKGKQGSGVKAIISQIEKNWRSVYPAGTFDFQFYDESLQLLYEKDRQTATLMNTAMGIAIFISCLGLFALSLFTAEKRAKEIAIRKVLGATVANIALLLSFNFVLLIIVALLIASPVAWYFMTKWLDGFAYRIAIHWWIFLAAGTAAIVIALITISFQATKAAMANPVKNLRTE